MKKSTYLELDPGIRAALEKRILVEGMNIQCTALTELLGSQGCIESLRPHSMISAQAFTLNMSQMFRIEGSDFERIAEMTRLWEMISGNVEGVQEIDGGTDKLIRVGYLDCPYSTGPKEICIWAHEFMITGICAAINPEYGCKFTQMISKGDPMCSYVIEKKK